MRKITITEIWDPIRKEFIPIRQAINQGLFNTRTYLFFSPEENKHYSITEAARKGLFKSAIDLRPEALVVERVKVAESVVLVAARDPADEAHLIPIRDAITLGIVDPTLKIYRNPSTNAVVDLGDAIDSDLVKVRVIRETTEKITETLTEQKTTDNLGLIKKIETRNFVSQSPQAEQELAAATSAVGDDNESTFTQQPVPVNTHEDYSSLNGDVVGATTSGGLGVGGDDAASVKQVGDDLFVFDRTKSYNISKRMRKYDDEVAAGFITDVDSKRLINQSKSQESPNTSKILVPIPDFTQAVANNLIILPDSLYLTQNVQYVVDTSTGNKFDFDAACDIGIIDVNSKSFIDTRRKKPIPLFEALEKNLIVMKDELGTNYDEEDLAIDPNARLKRQDLKTLFNPKTGNQVPVQKAIDLGIYDPNRNVYVDLVTRRVMSLEDAVDRGLVVLRQDKYQNKANEGYQFLNITGIIDPMTRQPMSLNEAIESGLLDHAECELHDPSSGKTLTLLEAYDRGFLLTTAKTYSAPVSASSAVDDEPAPTEVPLAKVTIDEPATKSEQPHASTRLSRRDELELAKGTKRKTLAKSETVTGEPGYGGSGLNPSTSSRSQLNRSFDQTTTTTPGSHQNPHRRDFSLASSVTTMTTTTRGGSRIRSQAGDNKSLDRMSSSSRRSVIVKLRDKFFGRRSKSNRFDEALVLTSLRVVDMRTSEKLKLDDAIKSGLVFGDVRVRDTLANTDYAFTDAIVRGLVKFYHPINEFEFKYSLSCYIFNNEWLLLVNYVLDPLNRRKIGLKNAFLNLIIDKENNLFYTKKGPIALFKAIDKGYICCEMIEMDMLEEIVMNHIVTGGGTTPAAAGSTMERSGGTRSSMDSSVTGGGGSDTMATSTSRDDENDTLLKAIFRRAELRFDASKTYTISEVLDTLNDRFVSLKKAQFMGIINLGKNEYVDTRTGIKLDVMTAIRTSKIRLENTNVTPAGVVVSATSTPSTADVSSAGGQLARSSSASAAVQHSSTQQQQQQQQPQRTLTTTSIATSAAARSVDLNASTDLENGGTLSRYHDLNSSSETRRAGAGASTTTTTNRTPAATSSSPSSISPRVLAVGGSSSGGVNGVAASSSNGGLGPGSSSGRSVAGGDLSQSSTFGDTGIEEVTSTNGGAAGPGVLYESMHTDNHRQLHSTLKKTSSTTFDQTSGLYANEPSSPIPPVPQQQVGNSSSAHNDLSFESFKSALESRMNGLAVDQQQQEERIIVEDETSGNAGKINLGKALLYKKVTNGKYVRFDTVVRNKLYNNETGRIKDAYSNEMIEVLDALANGTLRLNDPNYLFDDSRIYYVETVLVSSSSSALPTNPTAANARKIPLADAVVKGLVDKKRCTIRYGSVEYSVREAMRRGYIDGKTLTSYEIKWMLDEYSRRVELRLASNKSLDRLDERDRSPVPPPPPPTHPTTTKNANNKLHGVPLESFTEFFVFDPDSERYVPVAKAFYMGIILNEPVRIKDPTSANYILIKDAVIKGLVACEKSEKRVPFKDRSSFFTYNRISYIIDCVYEPKRTIRFSLQEAIRTRIFVNGVYKNHIRNESYHIDEAIAKGYIVGKQVDMENIESIFRSSLDTTNEHQFAEIRSRQQLQQQQQQQQQQPPPSKPTRGVFVEQQQQQHHQQNGEFVSSEDLLNVSRRSGRSKSSEKRKKSAMPPGDEGVLKSSIETFAGKVLLVQDLSTSKFLKPDEAEKIGLINFLNGTYENSLTGERIKISEAIEHGFIVIEKFANETIRQRSTSANSSRRMGGTSTSSAKSQQQQQPLTSSYDNYDNFNYSSDAGRSVEMTQQFEIVSVVDPVRKVNLDLDEAIRTGLFDMATGMYRDSRTGKKLTMIDAIDTGLIKLSSNNAAFRTSYKLQIEEFDRNFVKHIHSHSLRYVIDPMTREIVPINIAVFKGYVDVDSGTYTGLDRIISLKEAYDQCLAFTVDDLNSPESKRAKLVVQTVRKSTTGKNMSLKSALAKNWLNLDRRVYIDKQINEEMPFSQALDLDFIVLKIREDNNHHTNHHHLNESKTSLSRGVSRTRSAQDGFLKS